MKVKHNPIISKMELFTVSRCTMDKMEAKAFFDAGSKLYNDKEFGKAISYYELALERFKKVENLVGEADSLLEIGNSYGKLKKFEMAQIYYKKSLDLYTKGKDLVGQGYALTGLGIISESNKNYEKSLRYYENSYKIFQEAEEFERAEIVQKFIPHVLLELGNQYLESNDFRKAGNCYKKSQDLFGKVKDVGGQGLAFTALGMLFERQKNYEESIEYYKRSLKLFQKSRDYEKAGIVSSYIANLHGIQDAVEDAIIDYKRSQELFRKVRNGGKGVNINKMMDELHKKRYKYRSSKGELLLLLFYLTAIAGSEMVTTYFSFQVGLVMDAAIIFALLVNSSLSESYNFSNLLRAMIVLPIIRMVGFSIPIAQIQPLYWFPIIAIPLFAASFTIMRAQGLQRENVGLKWGNIPVQLIVASTGIFLGFIEYFILLPGPLIATFNLEAVLTASVILIISTGFAEELLFRGIIQKNAENLLGTLLGLLYASLLFTSLHVGWNSPLDLIFVFAVGLFYGYVFQITRSIFGITLSHGISNVVLFLIIPFLVF